MSELDPELKARFASPAALGLEATVSAQVLGATLRPVSDAATAGPFARSTMNNASWLALSETLPIINASTPTVPDSTALPAPMTVTPELRLGEVLGEGGMGIVRLAVQSQLHRDVAVKTVKPSMNEARDVVTRTLLIKEAVTTGGLEHPNIVPVHTLGRDVSGAPLLVMKRISGVPWSALIHDPLHPGWESVAGDRLEFHLETLMAICNAVHFAHSRRVVHRDLKPDNVMIGHFGEVYVLDWGIAVPLGAAPLTETGLAGTPAYLAPEMARGDVAHINERTDVYLLGALLHEVLTGEPPHTGSTLLQALESACSTTPRQYPSSVPPPLAVIARRAMHHDSKSRYATADELRRALAEFLRQRGSLAISEEATQRLETLHQLLAEGASAVSIYKVFGECRFGFQHAVEAFSDNQGARRGLREAITVLAKYELGRRNAEAAAAFIAELEPPDADLVQRLALLERELATDKDAAEKLRRLQHEGDVQLGSKARALAALLVAVAFNAGVLLVMRFSWGDQVTVARSIGIAVAFLLSVGAAGFIAREVILQNAANRRLAWSLGVACLGMLLHRLVIFQLGAPVDAVFAGDLVILATSGGTVAATLDRRFLPVSVFLALTPFVIALWPAWMPYSFPLTATVGAGVLALGWRR